MAQMATIFNERENRCPGVTVVPSQNGIDQVELVFRVQFVLKIPWGSSCSEQHFVSGRLALVLNMFSSFRESMEGAWLAMLS